MSTSGGAHSNGGAGGLAGEAGGTGGNGVGYYNGFGSSIWDYCSANTTGFSFTPPSNSCKTVTFKQSGIPSGVTWGVMASWGPFLSEDHTGTGMSLTIQASGSLNYSYDVVNSSETTYSCISVTISGTSTPSTCSGTTMLSTDTTFNGTYSAAISSSSSTVAIEGGSASTNDTSTGVDVQISGSSATDGTDVTIASSKLVGQPSGTGTINLGKKGSSFYDVQVSSSQSLGSGAQATICITGSSVTRHMEYWNGTSWLDASNVSVNGNTVCGTIPVSALSGTPIVIGSPVTSPPPAMVDGNVTIYSSTDTNGEILFTANASIFNMHSSTFTESAVPQYGTLPNGTYGYLGYYQGIFTAVSGGQKGANVTITVNYDGVSETASALSPGVGNTTSVDFLFQ